jgi:hypothetical protein
MNTQVHSNPSPSIPNKTLPANGFQLDADGYFSKGGTVFIPVGANYWPGSCGLRMWEQWPADEIQRDLDLMVSLGLNTLRFFLRWQDFEPTHGQWSKFQFERLHTLLRWGAERDLALHPSLFVGWMSGGEFWPEWKGDRNLFADSHLRQASIGYASRCAEALFPFRAHLLAVDLGNELSALREAGEAGTEAVAEWCGDVSAVLKCRCPGVLIVAGNDQSQIVGESGWELGRQPGTDLYSMHTYPTPTWHPVRTDGMNDPLCHHLLPFYTRLARSYGPTFIQEFGTLLTSGESSQQTYLAKVISESWEAGANGFLWWCLRDIESREFPYTSHGMERSLGLVDRAGRVKPGLAELHRQLTSNSLQPIRERRNGGAAIYWSDANAGKRVGSPQRAKVAGRCFLAHYFASRWQEAPARIVRSAELAGVNPPETLILTADHLPPAEMDVLMQWCDGGGRLLWHGVNLFRASPETLAFIGVRPDDFRNGNASVVEWDGHQWPITYFPDGLRFTVQAAEDASVVEDLSGIVVASTRKTGRGRCTAVFATVEDQITEVSNDIHVRDAWLEWYRSLLQWKPL